MANKKTFGQIIAVKIEDLKPYGKNARTHAEQQIGQIVESIREFGFTNPVLIDSKNGVIAGHARLEAAKRLDMKEIPCIVLAGLTEAQKRAYVIALCGAQHKSPITRSLSIPDGTRSFSRWSSPI